MWHRHYTPHLVMLINALHQTTRTGSSHTSRQLSWRSIYLSIYAQAHPPHEYQAGLSTYKPTPLMSTRLVYLRTSPPPSWVPGWSIYAQAHPLHEYQAGLSTHKPTPFMSTRLVYLRTSPPPHEYQTETSSYGVYVRVSLCNTYMHVMCV